MKAIYVPKSKEAMKRLDYDECLADDLLELHLNNEDYAYLNEIGLFEEINKRIGKCIDEYEDEEITKLEDLIKIHSITLKLYKKTKKNILLNFLSKIQFAIDYKTGVFFYF